MVVLSDGYWRASDDWLRVRRRLDSAVDGSGIPESERVYVSVDNVGFLPDDVVLYRVGDRFFVLRSSSFKKDGFKYIKPDEVEEYKRRGYRIERGPKGGIKAFFPNVKSVGELKDNFLFDRKDLMHQVVHDLAIRVKDLDIDKNTKSMLRLLLGKAELEFAESNLEIGLCFVAFAILSKPDIFDDDFISVFWGSRENFDEWVKKNLVKVKDRKAALLVVDDFDIVNNTTFKPIIMDSLVSKINTEILFNYVWYRHDSLLNDFKKNVNKVKVFVVDGFVDGDKIIDEFVGNVAKMTYTVEEILNQGPVDIDDDKIFNGFVNFDGLIDERLSILRAFDRYDYDIVNGEVFSFENLFDDLITEAERYMDRVSARLFVHALAFMKVGFSKEEAYSLSKGWELARFWTGQNFKTYTHYIEKMIVECNGNHRHVRRLYQEPQGVGKLFFERYSSCRDLENWRKFVQAYLKDFLYGEDEIKIYRGVRTREVGQAIIDYILDGEVKLGGVAESGTIDEDIASEWSSAGWIFETTIPVDLVIGCWLNSSKNYAVGESEVMFEKPPGGLPGVLENDLHPEWNLIFSDKVFSDENVRELAIRFMEDGLKSIEETYGVNSDFYKWYNERYLKAKAKLLGETVKSLLKSL